MTEEGNERCVTVLVIGESGVGKSQNGCAFLEKDDAFETDSSPDSCTYRTSAQRNVVNGITRYYIDTQGLASTDGLDAEYIQQMVEFLKEWRHGVNAFFIVLNVQSPRFDQGIQRLIQLINDFFNNPDFWNQTGIIFTRCYPNYFNKEVAETRYRQKVVDFVKTLPGCSDISPQMPCFFVDSLNYRNDEATRFEYVRAFEFAHRNNPVPTQRLQVVRPDYKKKEEEELKKVLIKEENVGEGVNKKKVFYYQDQKRSKITDWHGNIRYTTPEVMREWTEEKKTKVEEETKVERNKTREEKMKWVSCGGRRYIIAGPKPKAPVHDYYLDTTNYTEYKRQVITDPEGNVTFGDWIKTREWSESQRS